MPHRILAINPGSTSTKIAVFEDEHELFHMTVEHTAQELALFNRITDQMELRAIQVEEALLTHGVTPDQLSAVVGRGGMLPPVLSGGYAVNERMKTLLEGDSLPEHASNLGALLADRVARPLGIPAYIYDAVSADEFSEVARITGIPEIERHSFCHVLNSKAMGRKYAKSVGKRYEELNLLVVHLGGGISVSAHQKGKIIDSISDDAGPFAPERSGSVPLSYIVDMSYSGLYSKKDIMRKIRGSGGLAAYFGTSDRREIEALIAKGNEQAKRVYEAMSYQIAKGIGNLCTVFDGPIDAIILTGGMANSEKQIEMISKRVAFLAPIAVLPGENEMESLALGALRILKGEEEAHEFSY